MTTRTQTASTVNPFFSGTTPASVAAAAVSVKITQRLVTAAEKRKGNSGDPPSSRTSTMSKDVAPAPPADVPQPTKKKRQSASPPAAGPPKIQKTRSTGSVKSKSVGSARSSRASSRAKESPEPVFTEQVYRSVGSSRSNSMLPVSLDAVIPRTVSVSKPEKIGDVLSSEAVVKRLLKSYETYFRNPDDPEDRSFELHETNYPRVELAYPATGVSEKFILLAPKDPDHYNPIMCLESTVHVLVKSFLTPEQQSMFGYVPDDLFLDDVPQLTATPQRMSSPPPQPSPAGGSTAAISSSPPVNLLRVLRRAINTHNGPLFVNTMDAINRLISSLKHPLFGLDDHWGADDPPPGNAVSAAVKRWDDEGLPRAVMLRIIEETYQRAVGPNVRALRKYTAFSSEVYGELTPTFVSEIVQIAGLKPGRLFLDLGSGVGNVVIQAALEAGCDTFGIEINPEPARVAREHAAQFRERCKMWAVGAGTVELEEGDMLKSRRLDELMCKADVVLVNNKVFLESLNEALRPKFLDLKEGAILISLKPFVPPNARITERNVDDMSAIFDVTERHYGSGSVSWGSGGGVYYVHRVDRTGYAAVKKRFERSQPTRRASSRKYTPSHLDD